MKPTENNAKSASTPRTGIFALLSNMLSAKGIGASVLLLALAVSLGFASTALAKNGQHGLLTTFGPEGPHAKSSVGFQRAEAVAVDEAGKYVYVYEGGTKIERFNLAGEPADFSAGPRAGTNELTGFLSEERARTELAVDNSSSALDPAKGDLYAVDYGAGSIEAFTQSGEPADFSEGPGAGTNVLPACGGCGVGGVAVDADGDIYMTSSGTGDVYAPSGALIDTFPIKPGQNGHLAVNSNGVIYDMAEEGIIEFVPSSFPVMLATTYTEVTAPLHEPPDLVARPNGPGDDDPYEKTQTTAIAVDPATNDLYVDQFTKQGENVEEREKHHEKHEPYEEAPPFGYIVQFDESGDVVGPAFGASGEGALIYMPGIGQGPASEGVAVDGASGNVYATDTLSGRQADIFGPLVFLKAQVESEAISEISETEATVTANINPEGEATTYRVEYAPSGEEGCFASESCAGTAPVSVGEGEVAVPIEAARLSGLLPGTPYVVRVLATKWARPECRDGGVHYLASGSRVGLRAARWPYL